jgi:hypothetical protein
MPSPQQGLHRSPEWRERFRGQFLKTKMCRFYEAGQCRFDEACPFAHSPEDLTVAPDLKKTSICTAWQRGGCKLSSDDCPFAHGDEELCLTNAFVAKPLSKRVRTTAESQGLTSPGCTSSSNPQDGEQFFLEEVVPAPPPPQHATQELADTASGVGNDCRPSRRQRRRNTAARDGPLQLPLPTTPTTANLQDADCWAARDATSPSCMGGPLAYYAIDKPALCLSPSSAPLPQDVGFSIPIWTRPPNSTYAPGGTSPQSPNACYSPGGTTVQLVPPMLFDQFDNTAPEKIAEMLRQAMPDYYED